jgi:hypothetical protein
VKRLLPLACVAFLTAMSVGCGEREFSAEELVEDLNAGGAELVLGAPLTGAEGVSVTTVDIEGAGEETDGAIVILDDADAATAEFERCESAVDFTCFRAGNAVIRFTALPPEGRAQLTEAVRSLASD